MPSRSRPYVSKSEVKDFQEVLRQTKREAKAFDREYETARVGGIQDLARLAEDTKADSLDELAQIYTLGVEQRIAENIRAKAKGQAAWNEFIDDLGSKLWNEFRETVDNFLVLGTALLAIYGTYQQASNYVQAPAAGQETTQVHPHQPYSDIEPVELDEDPERDEQNEMKTYSLTGALS